MMKLVVVLPPLLRNYETNIKEHGGLSVSGYGTGGLAVSVVTQVTFLVHYLFIVDFNGCHE